MRLSICYTTSRPEPELRWLIDSLAPQIRHNDLVELIVVDQRKAERSDMWLPRAPFPVIHLDPQPCAWSGPHRKTTKDWWSKANSLNTFLNTASHPWIACFDDRSVILPRWRDTVQKAMDRSYMVCGAYEKRHSLGVVNGVVVHAGIVTGEDGRLRYLKDHGIKGPFVCPSSWGYGCNYALPKSWARECGGWDWRCDGLGFEDVLFSMAIANNGHQLVFDPASMLIEDRTVEKLGPPMERSSKERHPHDTSDKAHTLLAEYRGGLKRVPVQVDTDKDWFDGQPLKEM